MPSLVTASRFNSLRNRIAKVLGTSLSSDPQFGYGQSLNSSTVVGDYDVNTSTTNLIDDTDYRQLYIDLVRARVHQIGSSAFAQAPFVVGDFDANGLSTDIIEDAYITGLESLMTTVEANKFSIYTADTSQALVETLKTSTGTALQGARLQNSAGAWNRTLSFIFKVTFSSEAERRHFFNSGGQIRMQGRSVIGSTTNSKTVSWQNLLNSVGQVAFTANSTSSLLGYGSGSSLGLYNLTGSYALIYQGTSATYSGNWVRIYALQPSGTEVQFRVYFQDIRSEGVDEAVYGNFYVDTYLLRPSGTVTVNGVATSTVTIPTPPTGTILTNITEI